jgi:hypothetical protein
MFKVVYSSLPSKTSTHCPCLLWRYILCPFHPLCSICAELYISCNSLLCSSLQSPVRSSPFIPNILTAPSSQTPFVYVTPPSNWQIKFHTCTKQKTKFSFAYFNPHDLRQQMGKQKIWNLEAAKIPIIQFFSWI